MKQISSLILAGVLGGCLGSASETPWPAEPADVDLGPAGEEELTKVPRGKATAQSSAPVQKAAATSSAPSSP